ncbi:MAG: hypothetical protein IPM53_12455 [Anaerolineaceae bacterium]|nr:hypothetical protein [Anaerolineaceae bacterium]
MTIEGISSWALNSSGQLFLILDGRLLIEDPHSLANFREIDQFVSFAAWSPDGNKIIYSVQQFQDSIQDFKLFNLNTNETLSMSNLVENFPVPPYFPRFRFMAWKPDSSGIIFLTVDDEFAWEGKLYLANFQANDFTHLTDVYDTYKINIFKSLPDGFFAFDHCGSPCEILSKFDYEGHFLWGIPFATMGRIVFASNDQLIINYGCADGCSPEDPVNKSIQQFDASSGEAITIWQIGEEEYFSGIEFPDLSPDEKYLGFYLENDLFTVLQIIDFNGRSYGQRPNSVIVDWRPGGGPVVQERMADGQTRLVYWPLDGSAAQVFISPGSFEFGSGKWSGDGRYFIYSSVDDATNQSHLTLWQPENGAPMLLQTAVGSDGFRNFAWLPDSTGVYFNFGRTELWKFAVETESLMLIASAEGE